VNGDAAAWRAEVAAIDLARLRWLCIAAGALDLVFAAVVPFLPDLRGRGYAERALTETTVAAACFALVTRVCRLPADSPWRMRSVWFCAALTLLSLNAWYFEVLQTFGQNSDYVLGVVMMSAIVLASPRATAVALGANHALFSAALLGLAWPEKEKIAGLVDGTMAVVIAWLVASLVYRARRAEFFQTRALAASNAELREVMAIAAHDLRSPLLGLRDLLGVARREPAAEAGTLARVLDLAMESCGAMVHLVSRLVEAHVAERAEGTLQLVPGDLLDACTAAVERLRATAEAKGQRVALALPPAPAVSRIDAPTLAQVIENLLGNALKFSPRGAAVECALFGQGDRWCVEVRDEGPGIPAEERGRLFQKFHRGSARPTGGESSTGLGLFIAKMLTEAMGGRVSHAPREPLDGAHDHPRGSVFRIELPAVKAS
jgi:signal transduction histidine kinase